jgi:endonuclease YncB( thermonuclease family)
MGTLTIYGLLEQNQLWPRARGDADTLKVSLAGIDRPCRFKLDGKRAAVTNVFDTAVVRGQFGSTPVVKTNAVTIRLQGIDAPELHYDNTTHYRQPYGESATLALGALLATGGTGPLPCRVETRVESPNDVCDLYARVVGDVIVKLGKRSVNLNAWLAAQGWVFPAFYTSMSSDEIGALTKSTEAARAKLKNIWRGYTPQIGPLDKALKERPKNSVPAPDEGPVIWPKFFRRLVEWEGAGAAGTLATWLAARATERFVPTGEFLAHGPASAIQQSLGKALDAQDRLTLAPKDFVIVEKQSALETLGGKKVTAW